MEDLRKKILNRATQIALKESSQGGKHYSECIDEAIKRTCIEFGISEKERIEIFTR